MWSLTHFSLAPVFLWLFSGRKKVKVKLLSHVWLFATPWSLPGSSLHGTVQARVLDWVAMPSSRGSSPARDQTRVSHIAGRCFTFWATREYNTHSYNFPPLLLSELEGLSLLSALSTITLWDLVGVLCGRVCVCVCAC